MNAHDIVAALSPDSWRGFPELRRYVRGCQTRAQTAALIQSISELFDDSAWRPRIFRLGVAGHFSTENLRPALTLEFLDRGLLCEQYHAPFGQLSQEIRNPASELYRSDAVVLFPEIAHYATTHTQEDAAHVVQGMAAEVAVLRQRFQGPVVVSNFVAPEFRPFGIRDSKQETGIVDFYRRVNLALSDRLRSETNVFILDAAHLSTLSGGKWPSLHKQHYLAGCALADDLTALLARELAAVAAALKGFAKKCLVLDLDNTLWGGIVGEDGVGGIKIGGSFPGNVYLELQRQILALYERGVILAINSRNNEADVWEVFDSRTEMMLKREHFSCARVNWGDKSRNIQEIADSLNIGTDSMVMLDDNAVERERIESAHPEVYVAPAGDVLEMVRFLSLTRLFDTLSFSAEDALRSKSYAAAEARKRAEQDFASIEEFLESLEIRLEIAHATEAQIGRVAQLTQKTNQFNLTTRRYSDQQVREMAKDSRYEVLYCACRDRFVDEGIIGVAIVEKAEVWRIDTFLLSCRVLGRGIEKAFLGMICAKAQSAGARAVLGEFIPTKKNKQTEIFYKENGFAGPVDEGAGSASWRLALPTAVEMWPKWIKPLAQETYR